MQVDEEDRLTAIARSSSDDEDVPVASESISSSMHCGKAMEESVSINNAIATVENDLIAVEAEPVVSGFYDMPSQSDSVIMPGMLDQPLPDNRVEPLLEVADAKEGRKGSFNVPPRDFSISAPKPGGLGYQIGKRAIDIVISFVVVAVLAIPVALICVAISIDSPGNPLFRQERIGLHGKIIRIIKLRTMVFDAHEHPERYMNPDQLRIWKREQKLEDDPRITRIGRFLRKTSLDELPQFLNVLKGDLSVIGPRPVTFEETFEFGDTRDEFLSVRPGITGWWQVAARNNATWEDGSRQRLELFYVRHASFSLDFRIFIRTFKAMGSGK